MSCTSSTAEESVAVAPVQYFSLCDDAEPAAPCGSDSPDSGSTAVPEEEDAAISTVESFWSLERLELETSKTRFLDAVHRQQKVEENVQSLLKRLENLQVKRSSAAALSTSPRGMTLDAQASAAPIAVDDSRKATEAAPSVTRAHGAALEELPQLSLPVVESPRPSGLSIDCSMPDDRHSRPAHTSGVHDTEGSKPLSNGLCGQGDKEHPKGSLVQAEASIEERGMLGEAFAETMLADTSGVASDEHNAGMLADMFADSMLSNGDTFTSSCGTAGEQEWDSSMNALGVDNVKRVDAEASCSSPSRDGLSFADRLLLAQGNAQVAATTPEEIVSEVQDPWHGWCVKGSNYGQIFYHKQEHGTSQWHMPPELKSVLGEWVQVQDAEGNLFWWNALLKMSSWTNPQNTTNIFEAAMYGDLRYLQLFICGGGILTTVDVHGCTALHYACSFNSPQIASFLLESRARADVRDHNGLTPLHWACHSGNVDAVKLFVEAGVDPDIRDNTGCTPMHAAAEVDSVGALQHLLSARGCPTVQDSASRTPAEVAFASGARDCATVLRHLVPQPLERSRSPAPVTRASYEANRRHGCSSHADNPAMPTAARCDDFSYHRSASMGSAFENKHTDRKQEQEDKRNIMMTVLQAGRPLLRGVQWIRSRFVHTDGSRAASWDRGRGLPVLEHADRILWLRIAARSIARVAVAPMALPATVARSVKRAAATAPAAPDPVKKWDDAIV